MFSILNRPTRLCDGISRREMLTIGGLGTLGLSLPALLAAKESAVPAAGMAGTFGRAKSVIYVWLQGGPPQHETFDPKPDAPSEIRGPFRPIQTNVPGIEFCELLPRIARMADKLAVVRSLHTDTDLHCASGYEVLTGYKYRGTNSRVISPEDWPYFGSILKMLKPSARVSALTSVWIPQIMRLNENVTPAGQTGGFVGRQWDPDRFTGDPSKPEYKVEGLSLLDLPPMRLQRRKALLEQVQQHFGQIEQSRLIEHYDRYQAQAFSLLSSGAVQQAFAIQEEPESVRDRYGRHQWGQCLLLARRLVEAGVSLVHVNWTREPGDSAVDNPMWDTHVQNPDRLEDVLCPMFDTGFTALIEDLEQRGLLGDTLVVAIGEFGRTPRINKSAGRDHWGSVFSFALAGAGIQTAQVYGTSDKNGAYPDRDPVTTGDLTATIFHLLGLPHESRFRDAQGQEHRVTAGAPIERLLGGAPATSERVIAGGDIARVPPYNNALLLNTRFSEPVVLRDASTGSRPKGWRARPIAPTPVDDQFGVRLVTASENPAASGAGYVDMGFGMAGGTTAKLELAAGQKVLLAQEMRNPRLGRFIFTVEAGARAVSENYYRDVFLKNFTCRLILFRYNTSAKDPRKRTDFIALEFQPPFATDDAPRTATFTVEKLLDSLAPGVNFPIGDGYGVAVEVEKTSDGTLQLSGSDGRHQAWIRIASAQLTFDGRRINDNVKV